MYGIKIISSNMLLESEDTPIIWRGVMIGNLVKQFFNEVNWGVELDFLLIDMPPGTGDVALTTFQFLPIDGIVVMTSPQSLVSMIVRKAIHMANEMNISILGVVENMAYVECKECKEKNYIFGRSTTKSILDKFDIDLLAELPIRENIAINVDRGNVEGIDLPEMDAVADKIIAELN
jgi:Mrp family chromosome partitioning ATPase